MPPSIVSGPGYLKAGFDLIRQPGIRRFAVAPVIVNIIVFAGIVWFGIDFVGSLMDRWLPSGDSWWAGALRGVLWTLTAALSLIALFFGFTAVANIIGAPFNGALSEAVERKLAGQGPPEQPIARMLTTLPRVLLNETGKVIYFAVIGLLAWVVPIALTALIPAVNVVGGIIAMVLSSLFLAWMHAVEYIDYPMANRLIKFKSVRRTVRSRRMLAITFGGAVLLVMAIPIVNLFAMPAAVAGATKLWHDHFKDQSDTA